MSVDNPPGNGQKFSQYIDQSFLIQDLGPKNGSFKAIDGGPNEPKKFTKLHWEIPSNVNCTVTWPPYATKSAQTE
ncbi:hypothetical protein AYI69_g6530 [Smittium culicis]|uniref:Uncharacterized protein n=1 Tax=Smittium culicis TaxID=133412 RepID=A0A1R1XYH9_9FUNG|nr:hypothetical protein AYI69_g6530 [Smittium culicis]